jgi:hypothetical protein
MRKRSAEATKEIEEIVNNAGHSLKEALENIGWLNSGHDYPIPERNTVIHLASALARRGFHVLAEAKIGGKRRKRRESAGNEKIDLVAYNGRLTLLFEVKTFGTVSKQAIETDMNRLREFEPSLASFGAFAKQLHRDASKLKRKDDFWKGAEDRWAVMVIQSFGGRELSSFWDSLRKGQSHSWVASGLCGRCSKAHKKSLSSRKAGAFEKLASDFDPNTEAGRTEVLLPCKYFEETCQLDLLWLAFRV